MLIRLGDAIWELQGTITKAEKSANYEMPDLDDFVVSKMNDCIDYIAETDIHYFHIKEHLTNGIIKCADGYIENKDINRVVLDIEYDNGLVQSAVAAYEIMKEKLNTETIGYNIDIPSSVHPAIPRDLADELARRLV